MNSDDQREVIAFLSTPEAYGSALPIERIDTHISVVWLVGDRAYKLKRAVHFDYANFSTIELRRAACEGEVRLNRRTAPALYLGVRPVTRESDGRLALGGGGTPVDWLVEMVRFDQQTLFDRLAERRELDAGRMEGLADAIVRLHQGATQRQDHGGRAGMAWVIDGNAQSFAEQGATILDPAACARLTDAARAALEQHADRLEVRKRQGFVRECHGDLHLRNICLVDGMPTLFDAVEFNDEISCIDVLYDLAFLLMDLWRRDLRDHANLVFNEYLSRTLDLDGLPLLPLFLSCRAAVRAKTSVSAAMVQTDPRQRLDMESASRQYLALAQQLLRPIPPCLVAVGGLSGSGKTTLARRLAPSVGVAPGALILRSDLIRKMLLGVAPTTRLGPEGYTDGRDHPRLPIDGRARDCGARGGALGDCRCRLCGSRTPPGDGGGGSARSCPVHGSVARWPTGCSGRAAAPACRRCLGRDGRRARATATNWRRRTGLASSGWIG